MEIAVALVTGGLVGYAGYDLVRYYENEKLNDPPKDDRGLPDVSFGLYDELVVFDHVDKTLRVVANARVVESSQLRVESKTDSSSQLPTLNSQLRHAYDDACRRVDLIVQRLQQHL